MFAVLVTTDSLPKNKLPKHLEEHCAACFSGAACHRNCEEGGFIEI